MCLIQFMKIVSTHVKLCENQPEGDTFSPVCVLAMWKSVITWAVKLLFETDSDPDTKPNRGTCRLMCPTVALTCRAEEPRAARGVWSLHCHRVPAPAASFLNFETVTPVSCNRVSHLNLLIPLKSRIFLNSLLLVCSGLLQTYPSNWRLVLSSDYNQTQECVHYIIIVGFVSITYIKSVLKRSVSSRAATICLFKFLFWSYIK